MAAIHARSALTATGWQDDLRIVIDGGRITALTPGARPQPDDERHGLVVPGMPNLHSHAFQRGMAGLSEMRGPTEDSFWSWRDVMYRFALSMTPDQAEAVAAELYAEMLESGFTRVGEFHYLHHDVDGRPYGDIAEMAVRITAAAATTGIALTLLPVFYAHATFGGVEPTSGQRRFVSGLDAFARLVDGSRHAIRALPESRFGLAPHSLRAATIGELQAVAAMAPDEPIHIHVAEQVKEVEDCIAWGGRRPVEQLFDSVAVDKRWCLIHATHMIPEERRRVAQSGAVVGLCPVTEGSLGDGIFPGRDYFAEGGRFGVGTDSNILIGVPDELRQLEYTQRLAHGARNVLATAGTSTGRTLFDRARAGGGQALAATSEIVVGAPADLVALKPTAGGDLMTTPDRVLDVWIFAERARVDTVWVNGVKRVADGRHVDRDAISARFEAAARELRAAI
ncbi:MAG: formimidoylglutamate deiminase [Pararhizobium sp.]